MAFQIEKKQTNADKYFRNATDEELAKWFSSVISDCDCNNFPCIEFCSGRDCKGVWLDWLKQEVESDG